MWVSSGLWFCGCSEIESKSFKVSVPLSPSLGFIEPWPGLKLLVCVPEFVEIESGPRIRCLSSRLLATPQPLLGIKLFTLADFSANYSLFVPTAVKIGPSLGFVPIKQTFIIFNIVTSMLKMCMVSLQS